MNIKITRDSVCAADDFDPPHEKIIRNIEKRNLAEICEEIKDNYLPRNVENGSTWIIYQDKELLGIIEYPSGIIKYYKSKNYKIANRQIPLFAKCIGSIPIAQYVSLARDVTIL